MRMAWVGDDLVVLRALAPHGDVAGAKVIAIEGAPTTALFDKLSVYAGGAQERRRTMAVMIVEVPHLLNAAGLSRAHSEVRMELVLRDGRTTSRTFTATDPPEIPYWPDRLSPEGFPGDPGLWKHALAPDDLSLYLRDFGDERRVVAIEDSLFVQIKWSPRARSLDEETFRSSLAAAMSANPRNLIIDLRFDHGGSTPLSTNIIKEAVGGQIGRGGLVWLILGPLTHESGIVAAATVVQASDGRAIIVGEQPGDRLRFWASSGRECLESAQACVVWAGRRFDVASGCADPSCAPDHQGLFVEDLSPAIAAPLSAVAYLAGRDPALEAINAASRRR